jgi:hypothetical protein
MIFATSGPETPISIRSRAILRLFGETIGADENIRHSPEAPKPSNVGNPKNFCWIVVRRMTLAMLYE